jgi:aminomethyltransferase
VRYSLLLDESGGILDDLMVTRWPKTVLPRRQRRDQVGRHRPSARDLPDEVTLNHLDDTRCWRCKGRKPLTRWNAL